MEINGFHVAKFLITVAQFMDSLTDKSSGGGPIRALRTLSSQQRRSGLAAWLGWLFDGLDMHIYTLVATPFVASLLMVSAKDPEVGQKASWIQAAFLIGWALGGAFFGRIGDLLGRSRALILTILCYAGFTGLSAISTEWWHLMIFPIPIRVRNRW